MTRLIWIDALKGLGMICVILGHTGLPVSFRQFLFSFHMPLFFFISGYLYKSGGARWCARKIDSLLIPYIAYNLVFIVVIYTLNNYDIHYAVKNFIMGNGIVVTWFLSCLLVVEIVGSFVADKLVDRHLLCAAIVVSGSLGIIMSSLDFPNIMMSRAVFAALTFWLLGKMYRNFTGLHDAVIRMPSWRVFIFSSTMFAVGTTLSMLQRVDMANGRFGNGTLFYVTAMLIILALMFLFERFNIVNRVLTFVGERSLEFMCFHAIIPMMTVGIVGELLPKGIIGHALLKIVDMSIVVCLVWCAHKWIPLLSGRFHILAK